MRYKHVLPWAMLAGGLSLGTASEPPVDASDLPRFPAAELSEAINTFQIKKGFRLELAAAEPLVKDPVALSFDENGRMYVIEMRDYSERREDRLGRVRLLEDTNNDGRFDKSTVFADGLPWPTAVICYGGGVFIGCTPDIIYLKDTTGDGKADVQEVVFTGFGAGRDRLNVQSLMNSFNWGLDNRIHGATSANAGTIRNLKQPSSAPLDLRGRDFYFDPRTFDLFPENGGGQHGFSYDDTGRKFVTSNSHHIRSFFYDDRYAGRNPHYAMPRSLVEIPVDGPAAEVFRISPDEPWRIVRTKWRVSGLVAGIVEGGGRVSGYFTGATGVTIYRGHAWPKEFLGDAFIGDSGGNLVHRKKIRRDSVGVLAERPEDERDVEFLASTDTWFRPVQFANGPDGNLYLIDMYREVIEHPWSIPQSIKQHLDLNSGNDRGRIYRIVPENFKRAKPVRLGSASTRQLVGALEHPNGWHRDTAARLLYERQDRSAVPALDRLLQQSRSPLGRLHALYALDGLGALEEAHVLRAMRDEAWFVREHAVRLSETFLPKGVPSATLWTRLNQLTADPDINVRYQLAFTLGEIRHGGKIDALSQIVRRDLGDSWMQAAVFSSLAEGAGELFALVARDQRLRADAAGQEFIRQLVQLIGTRNDPGEIAGVIDFISKTDSASLRFTLTRALGEGLQRGGSSLSRADTNGVLKQVLEGAGKMAMDGTAPESDRVEAVQLLGLSGFGTAGERLLALVSGDEPQAVQLTALATLGRFSEAQVGTGLIQRWANLGPRARTEAVAVLLGRPERALALLDAMSEGTIRLADLSSTQIRFLRNHRDGKVKTAALKILGPETGRQRKEVVAQFVSAISLSGDTARGRTLFEERCASCHRFGGQGYALGPDMETMKAMSKDQLLLHILDPNSEVPPQYLTWLVELNDDETLIGLVADETPTSVTVRQAFGNETVVLRSDIRRMESQEQSLMPEGLEAGLTPQDFADMLEFITAADARAGR